MSMAVENPPPQFIKTIEWDMMDKTKFIPLSMLSSFSVRCALYPLTLIKTRLQIQKRSVMYSGKWINHPFFIKLVCNCVLGMFDAYGKILKYEGFSGLYKGFWVSSVQIFSGTL